MSLLLALSFLQVAHAEPSLTEWSAQILNDVKQSTWTSQCVQYLTQLGSKLDQLNASSISKSTLRGEAEPLMNNLWSIRLALHDRLSDADDACAHEIRNAFRRFRFFEDFLGEIRFSPQNLDPLKLDFKSQKTPIDEFTPGYFLQTNGNFDLRPGDLILARGVSFLSGMISRLGDTDSQFSHVVAVTQNPNTQAIETIESYVGVGVQIYDRQTALKNENARLLVLRPKDSALALQASQQMRAYVVQHSGKNTIPYDYALNFNEYTRMSCAEVSKFEFLTASNGAFQLPERVSLLSRGKDLLSHLGVQSGPTFTPGDLEGDSRFEIVGEWRDLRITRDSRLKDAIFTKIFEWMDQDAYVLHSSTKSWAAGGVIWDVRRTPLWPVVKKVLGLDDFSAEIPRNMVSTVELIGELAGGMLKNLTLRDALHELSTGMPMTYIELYQALEQMRADDSKTYQDSTTRKNSIILKYLRTK